MTMTTMTAGALAALLAHTAVEPAPSPTPMGLIAEEVPSAEALTGRVFDLRGLELAAPAQQFVSRTSTLLPLIDGMGDVTRTSGYLNGEVNSDGDSAAHAIVETFVEAYIHGEDAELELVEVLEKGLVYLVGSTEVLDQFEEFVAHMGASLALRPTLEIVQFRVTEEAAQSLPEDVRLGGQVERAKLMAWLADGIEFTERRMDLPGGGIRIISDLESHTITASVGAQIAQGSGIFEPQTFEAAVGSELTLSGYRSDDGVELRYMVKSTERRDAQASRSYRLETRHFPEQGRPTIDQSEGWSEDFGTAGGHSVGSASVGSSHYLVLSVGTSKGHMRCVAISVDPASVAQPAVSRIDAPTGLSVVAVPGGLTWHNDLTLAWSHSDAIQNLECKPNDVLENGEGLFRAELMPMETSLFERLMESATVHAEYPLLSSALFVVSGDDAARVAQWSNFMPKRKTYHVAVKTRDALGHELDRGSVSVQSGTSGALVSGYEQLLAKGTGVEVAQRFATREVITSTHFEGLALGIELGESPGGTLLYGLRGQMATDLDISESSANESVNGGLVAVSASHLVIRETGTATPAETPGTWTIVVGDETRKGAYVELTVSTQ